MVLQKTQQTKTFIDMSYAVNFEQCPEFSISEYLEDDYEYAKLHIMGIAFH